MVFERGQASPRASRAFGVLPKRSRTRGRPGNLLLPNHQSKAPSRKQASTSTVLSDRRRSPSAGHAQDKRDQEDHQEYEEQYLRDTRRRRGDAAKPKNGCDDRDDQEYQRPVENGKLQLTGRGQAEARPG